VQWPRVVRELVRVTRPGGWVELTEFLLVPFSVGQNGAQASKWTELALNTRGIDPYMGRDIADYLRKAGLVNIGNRDMALPCGEYGGKIGNLGKQNLLARYRSFAGALMKLAGVSHEEFEANMKGFSDELDECRTYVQLYVAWGQKPL